MYKYREVSSCNYLSLHIWSFTAVAVVVVVVVVAVGGTHFFGHIFFILAVIYYLSIISNSIYLFQLLRLCAFILALSLLPPTLSDTVHGVVVVHGAICRLKGTDGERTVIDISEKIVFVELLVHTIKHFKTLARCQLQNILDTVWKAVLCGVLDQKVHELFRASVLDAIRR